MPTDRELLEVFENGAMPGYVAYEYHAKLPNVIRYHILDTPYPLLKEIVADLACWGMTKWIVAHDHDIAHGEPIDFDYLLGLCRSRFGDDWRRLPEDG